MASDTIIGAGLCESPYARERARAEGLTLMLHAEMHRTARMRALLERSLEFMNDQYTGTMAMWKLRDDIREEIGDD